MRWVALGRSSRGARRERGRGGDIHVGAHLKVERVKGALVAADRPAVPIHQELHRGRCLVSSPRCRKGTLACSCLLIVPADLAVVTGPSVGRGQGEGLLPLEQLVGRVGGRAVDIDLVHHRELEAELWQKGRREAVHCSSQMHAAWKPSSESRRNGPWGVQAQPPGQQAQAPPPISACLFHGPGPLLLAGAGCLAPELRKEKRGASDMVATGARRRNIWPHLVAGERDKTEALVVVLVVEGAQTGIVDIL